MQQIIVSGLGGQGVLFITKVLADTALRLGYSVLVSETHGMAQRGGNVISHLKVAKAGSKALVSPLVRPGRAGVLLALHPESFGVHGFFLKKEGGAAFCNTSQPAGACRVFDATAAAAELGSAVSANLALLGFASAKSDLFCDPEELAVTLKSYGGKRLEMSLKAFEAGRRRALFSPPL